MGMAYAYKKGELDTKDMPAELVSKIKSMADSMTTKELKDFASTKHDGLPEVKPKASANEHVHILNYDDFINESNIKNED